MGMNNRLLIPRSSGSVPAGKDLYQNAVTAWLLGELSGGNRLDSSGNSRTLTDTNTNVAQGPGPNAGQCASLFTYGTTNVLTIADAAFQAGTKTLYFAGWYRPTSTELS